MTSPKASSWTMYFKEKYDDYSGYVTDELTANELLKAYEIETTSSFTVFKKTLEFSDSPRKQTTAKHRIRWEDQHDSRGFKLEFKGMPFEIMGVKILECQNGPDGNKAKKKKESAKKSVRNVRTCTN